MTLALAFIRAYQLVLSPIFTGSCRFVPSCSEYAAEAVRLHGVGLGSWLAVRRLARCHPLCAGGHDPVPAYGKASAGSPESARAAAGRPGSAKATAGRPESAQAKAAMGEPPSTNATLDTLRS